MIAKTFSDLAGISKENIYYKPEIILFILRVGTEILPKYGDPTKNEL